MSAAELIRHTPFWVFLLLFFLLRQGMAALRTRTVTVPRLAILPLVFLLMSLRTMHPTDAVGPMLAWLAALVLLIPLGWRTGPRLLAVGPDPLEVTLAGSPIPLVRNVGVFTLQYGIAVAVAHHPGSGDALAVAARAISGATAGYFIGWAASLCRGYRAVPAT